MGKSLFRDATPGFWYCLGWLTGAVTAFLFVALYLAVSGLDAFQVLKDTIKEWQTLIAGALALIGAALTVRVIERQIRLVRDQEEDRRERKQYADRTALPTALMTLCKYAKNSITILKSLTHGITPSDRILFEKEWIAPKVPKYPFEAVATLRTCLETTDTDKRGPLAEILRRLQIQNARLEGVVRDVSPGSNTIVVAENLATFLVDSLDLFVRCNITIPYARGDIPTPPNKIKLSGKCILDKAVAAA